MADPYVNWAPAEVGPCTATWFVGIESGSASNESPTFGQSTLINPTAAWDFLVNGPLKDVLTGSYATDDEALEAWARAGGQVDFIAQSASAGPVYGAEAHISRVYPVGQMAFFLSYDSTAYPIASLPVRWVVKFSVPHSIIK